MYGQTVTFQIPQRVGYTGTRNFQRLAQGCTGVVIAITHHSQDSKRKLPHIEFPVGFMSTSDSSDSSNPAYFRPGMP